MAKAGRLRRVRLLLGVCVAAEPQSFCQGWEAGGGCELGKSSVAAGVVDSV